MAQKYTVLMEQLQSRRERVISYLNSDNFTKNFKPIHLKDAVLSYIIAGGKSLRPAILMLSCSAVNGNEETALPAASAIEVFHTWTLVHDDIIDRDTSRRGLPTVHKEFAERGMNELFLDNNEAEHYGVSIGILAGDSQLGWAVKLMCELQKYGVDSKIVLQLLERLTWGVLNKLIEGETLDVQYSKKNLSELTDTSIVDMLWKKTGVLYEFAATAGAMIGLNTENFENNLVKNIGQFASECGIAFQLKDDILGIIGDEKLTGKPVGSDIREGKKTTIIYYALKNASKQQSDIILSTLGNSNASAVEIEKTTELLKELGGIDQTQKLAESFVSKAIPRLNSFPDTKSRSLLIDWANYLTDRDL